MLVELDWLINYGAFQIMPLFDLDTHRHLFPALANKAYFNYGGQGVLAETTLQAITTAFKYGQQQGPFGLQSNARVTQIAQQTRHALAQELGVAASTITLTEDVTVGCNIALWGLDWQPGDHILLTDCEHPGVVAAIAEIKRRYQVTSSMVPLLQTLQGADVIQLITSYLQPTTKLVVLSHVLWNTGQVLPLAAMSAAVKAYPAAQEIRLLVDAAQSVGMLPLQLTELNIDFYAFTGHKWCCGPEGVGGLYVSPAARESLRPTFIGWRSLSYEAATSGGLLTDGRQYEVATSAYPLYAGLTAALALHNSWGDRLVRYQQIVELATYLWQGLQAITGVTCLLTTPPASGLVAFQLAGIDPDQAVPQLESQHIFVRSIVEPSCLRAGVHYFTSQQEVDMLLTAIHRLLQG
jgi:L-cysteine/cystine lyase